MTDDIWKRDEIESPCVKVCIIHPEARICIGCHRSIDEITGWSEMNAGARREILDALPARGKLLARRSGGRGGRVARQRARGPVRD